MELKPGYKQTEVGNIPDDWDVTTVGDEFSIQLGKMIDAEKNFGVLKPYLGNRAVQWGRINLDEIGMVRLTTSDLNRFLLQKGDLLVCEGGEVGRAAIWHDQLKECYFQKALHRLRPLRGYNVPLMQNVLLHLASRGLLDNFVTQTSIAHLPKDKFLTVRLPLPPPREQRAIAEALGDVDELIESLEQLISKKRQIKQGAMQELLRPKAKWIERRLDAVAKIRSGGTPSTVNTEYWSGDILWCTPTDITALERYKYISATERSITDQGLRLSSAELIPANSIVMTTRATIGECAINVFPITTNQGFKNFIPLDHIDVEFLYYLLQTKKQDLIGLCIGSTFLEISKRQLSAFEIHLPADKSEQSAIASVLAEIDAEIVALEKRLFKARQIKQGMVQELLTGSVRLVHPESNLAEFPAKEKTATAPKKGHNSAINEAVVISILAKNFASDQYPLGRKRYTKLSYLLHRHAEGNVEGYLAKAAGPYNPSTKYKGAEKIALSNRYVRSHARDNFSGFVAGEKIAEAEGYFSKWYGDNAIGWLEQFRYKKNDELELLATVDMAMVNLRIAGTQADLASVKQYLHDAPEWTAKLSRSIFSDENIDLAIKWSRQLFEANAD